MDSRYILQKFVKTPVFMVVSLQKRERETHVGMNGGSCLHPDPPAVLLLLEAVEEKTVEQLVQQLLQILPVCRRNQIRE